MFFAASALAGTIGGCGAQRGEPPLPGTCVSGQPGCFAGDDDADPATTGAEPDEDSGPASDPLPPADDGAGDGPAAGTGSGPADIPDDQPDSDDGEAEECGAEFARCLEDGGNLASCLPLYEDCGEGLDGGADGGDPGDFPDCCDEIASTCGDGPPDSTCGAVQEVCDSGDCTSLRDLCPPEQVPVSEACAYGYLGCHPGFQVNNCVRVLYDACMLFVDDAEFCGEREEACDARIAYCQGVLGLTGTEFILCAEQGQYFDPCWESLGCTTGAASCTTSALLECTNPSQGQCSLPL